MAEQTVLSTPGTVWMREDHALVVSVPHESTSRQSEAVVRTRLREGVRNRWPAALGDDDLISTFLHKVQSEELVMMEPEACS